MMKFIDIFFTIAGILGMIFIVGACLHTMVKIFEKRKFFSLILFFSILSLFFIPITVKVITIIAGFVLISNALFYDYFMLNFLFHKKAKDKSTFSLFPEVSIIIPAKNESHVIKETLISLSQINYPKSRLNIIVIDDNSTDGTYEVASSMNHLENLQIIRNEESYGKSKAINTILKTIETEYTLILDADHLVEKNYIRKVLLNFEDPKVACVQTVNTVRNGNTNILSRLVQMEYLSRYEVLYAGREMALFMGSGGIFRTSVLKNLGGFDGKMLTEDLEISYRIYEAGYKIVLDDSIATHELATIDIKNYYKQRHRWFRGIWQSYRLHFLKMLNTKMPVKNKLFFLHVILEYFALLSYLYTIVLYSLDTLKIITFDAKYLVYIETVTIAIALSISFIKTKKFNLFLFLPLIVIYYIFYSLPNLLALIDNWILKSEKNWVKTERTQSDNTGISYPVFVPTNYKESVPLD